MSRPVIAFVALALCASSAGAQNGDRQGENQPALPPDLVVPEAPVLTPEEALASFQLHAGFELQLVAAEPLVVDPVQIVFDERGRLWVVEMRGYMPDPKGTGEREPRGCIAILSDTDGDGRMDQREVFADGLVLPRAVHPCEGGALVIAPPELLFLRDDDGDGAFDTREILEARVDGLENPEHAINGLLYGRDNWYHLANWSAKYRRVEGKWLARRTGGGGQWGLSQDDAGRLFFNTNSDPLRADVVPSTYARRNPGLAGSQRRRAREGRAVPSPDICIKTRHTHHPQRTSGSGNASFYRLSPAEAADADGARHAVLHLDDQFVAAMGIRRALDQRRLHGG